MLAGFNLLLWTTHLTDALLPHCEAIKRAGYDGVELPVFEGDPAHYRAMGARLDGIGLRRTAVGIVQRPEANPMSLNLAAREAGLDHLKWMVECCAEAGVELLCGPFHGPLGIFTGTGPTERELEVLAHSHRQMARVAHDAGVKLSVEPLNRFECYVLNTMAQSKALVDDVGFPGYGCLFDTFHANIEERSLGDAIRHAGRAINHVHFSENDRGTPGRGHINYKEVTAALKEIGYDDWIVIEAFGQSLAEIAAATKVWRPLFGSEDEVVQAGIDVIQSHWAEPRQSKTKRRIKLGMVGGGNEAFIGAVHRIAARLDDHFDLVAGALSSTPEKSQASGQALGLERIYPDFNAMLTAEKGREDGIDAVAIVTPNHMHFEPAAAFLRAGIHVICEKPMTLTVSEAKKLAQIAETSDALFVLTHNYTGYPMVRHARQMIADGAIGRIRVVQVEYPQEWLSDEVDNKQATWRTDPGKSGQGGSIGDIGTHAFNLAEYVTGLEVTALAADLHSFVPGRRLDDNAHILLRLTGEARGMLWSSQVAHGHENALRLRVYGEKGGLEWAQEEPNTLWHAPENAPRCAITRGSSAAGDDAGRLTRLPTGHPEGYLEAFANIYAEAAEAIRCHKTNENPSEAVHFPSVHEGLRGLKFIEACVTSSNRNGSWTEV